MNKNQNLYIGNSMVAKLCNDTDVNKLCLGDNVVFHYMEKVPIPYYINIEYVKGNTWTDNGKKTINGVTYQVYRSDMHKDKDWTTAKITFYGIPNFKIAYGSYAETKYDYVILSELDATILSSLPSSGKYSSSGAQSAAYPNLVATYNNDGGVHHIYVYYRKDVSGSKDDDCGAFGVEVLQ